MLRLLELLFYVKENYTDGQFKELQNIFLDKLVFAVNQPNREKLKNIIESEVSDKNSGIYEKFQEEIFHWLGEAEGTCITKENFKDYKIVAGESNKKYTKSPWIRSMAPGVMYRLELLMFYVHRAFIMHEYGDFSIQVGDKRDSEIIIFFFVMKVNLLV